MNPHYAGQPAHGSSDGSGEQTSHRHAPTHSGGSRVRRRPFSGVLRPPQKSTPPRRFGQRPPQTSGRPPHHRDRMRRMRPPTPPPREIVERNEADRIVLPPLDGDTVRIIPIGGVEEVGRNMTLIELQEGIMVFDAGFQFVSEDVMPGIDYMLPNTRYLEENKDRILGVFITHGHLDHIGGIPYLIDRIGNPPIYTQHLTSLMIKNRQEEFPHLPEIKMNVIEPGGRIVVGGVTVKTFPVTHSIPDSM